MTFEQALNNRPTAYNFSREKWNKVSDVDALVASLKEAHEQEIAELSATEEFMQMPVYPYYGSVQMIGSILVVKLS